MPNPTKKPATLVTSEPRQNIEEQIRTRAYQLYEERGREDGRDVDDWLRAEAEITGKTAESAAA